MRLNVSDLKNKQELPLVINFSFSLEDLDVDNIKAESPMEVNLTAAYADEKREIIINGNFKVKISAVCHRCLKKFSFTFDDTFYEVLFEDELVSGEDDFYTDGKINLIPFIKEHFLLKLPIKFLCSEKCPGLCPQCGQDLSLKECTCEKETIDPRLEVLKTLLKDSES